MEARLVAIALCCMLGACSAPSPTPDACSWLKPVILDPGYGQRLTDEEMRQVLTLDEQIVKVCPKR